MRYTIFKNIAPKMEFKFDAKKQHPLTRRWAK